MGFRMGVEIIIRCTSTKGSVVKVKLETEMEIRIGEVGPRIDLGEAGVDAIGPFPLVPSSCHSRDFRQAIYKPVSDAVQNPRDPEIAGALHKNCEIQARKEYPHENP